MDRRQEKTRRAVFTAFEELISRKRYDEITVQEIIDRADIGRATFYAHFKTKDSLLDALCQDLFSHIFADHLHEESTHDFSGKEHSEQSMLTHTLYHLREDKARYGRLFTGESGDIFWNRFRALFQQRLEAQVQAGRWQIPHDLPEDLYMRLYTSSFVEIVTWWFGHDCEEAPERVADYFEKFCGIRHTV